jgi:hypothetical protein
VDQEQRADCNSDIYVGSASASSGAQPAKNLPAKKTKKKTAKKTQAEEGRRALAGSGGRKGHGRKQNFKPAAFLHFHSAADSETLNCL